MKVPQHLHTLFERATAKRNKEEQKAINCLLNDFKDVFNGWIWLGQYTSGGTSNWDWECSTSEATPKENSTSLCGWRLERGEEAEETRVIQPSTSPWTAPHVMVWKKEDGSARMCLDYCRINAVTEDMAYPIPHTQDFLDAVAGSGMFSIKDITAAYHQTPVAEKDTLKTAFFTKYGLYEFKTMPFRLKAPLQTFK